MFTQPMNFGVNSTRNWVKIEQKTAKKNKTQLRIGDVGALAFRLSRPTVCRLYLTNHKRSCLERSCQSHTSNQSRIDNCPQVVSLLKIEITCTEQLIYHNVTSPRVVEFKSCSRGILLTLFALPLEGQLYQPLSILFTSYNPNSVQNQVGRSLYSQTRVISSSSSHRTLPT